MFPFTQTRTESANACENVCMESHHSHTAYRIRMPQPQAAYAYRVYGILALVVVINACDRRHYYIFTTVNMCSCHCYRCQAASLQSSFGKLQHRRQLFQCHNYHREMDINFTMPSPSVPASWLQLPLSSVPLSYASISSCFLHYDI